MLARGQGMARAVVRGVFGGQAWSLGRVAGIPIAIDRSWILIFLLITFSLGGSFAAERPDWPVAARWGAALSASLLFFASIVLHELGHSLTALPLGVRVRSITLFLFGGLAALESEPRRPRDEILIAVAGPLVSALLGAAFLGLAAGLPDGPALVAGWLGRINLMLAVFNVLPGFPLDGGRVLRGVAWAATGSFEQATRMAAASGAFLAYGLMGLGGLAALLGGQVLGGLWLVFIGWFLLSTARLSVAQVELEQVLAPVSCRELVESVSGALLDGSESAASVIDTAVLRRGLRTFYVVDAREQLRGLVTLGELAAIPPGERAATAVESVMRPAHGLVVVAPGESAWQAFRKMAEGGVNQLPVLADGRLVGAITRERLVQLVQAGASLRSG